MSLSVAPLAGFPAINSTLQRTAGTPTDAASPSTGSYSSGVYTQSGTQYVAGIIDQQGINPSRIFFCDNGTGSGSQYPSSSFPLPTLVTITQVSANGQSIQELPSTSFEVVNHIGYSGFIVLLNAAVGGPDDGFYPLGYDNAIAPSYANVPGWTSQGGAYTNAAITVGYPNPQMRFFLTFNAMLIFASTSTG